MMGADAVSSVDFLFGYRAFGLYLLSNLPIPWLVPSANNSGLAELRICLGGPPAGFNETHYGKMWYSSSIKGPSGESALNIFQSRRDGRKEYWIKYLDGTQIFVGENASRIWVE